MTPDSLERFPRLTCGQALDDLEDPQKRPNILQFLARPIRWRHRITQDAPAQRKIPTQPATYKPSAGPLLSRPHRNISGRRHVPVLVNANRFPFLRIKKPQPASLSGIIRSTARTRENRILRTEALREERVTAQDEQDWDKILEKQLGVKRDEDEQSVAWQTAIDESVREIGQRSDRAIKKRMAMAELMTDIVEKEAALAQEERLQRLDKAHKIRKARRLRRQGRDPAASGLPTDELAEVLKSKDGAEPGFNHPPDEIQPESRAPHSKNVDSDSSITSDVALESAPAGAPGHSVEPELKDSQNPFITNSTRESRDDGGKSVMTAALLRGQSLREALMARGPRPERRWRRTDSGEIVPRIRNEHHTVYRPAIDNAPLPPPETMPQLVRDAHGGSTTTKAGESNVQSKGPSEADPGDAAATRELILEERARRKEVKARRKEEKARASEERARQHREAHQRKKAAKLYAGSFAGRMKRWVRAQDFSARESGGPEHTPEPEDSRIFAGDGGTTSREETAKRQGQDP